MIIDAQDDLFCDSRKIIRGLATVIALAFVFSQLIASASAAVGGSLKTGDIVVVQQSSGSIYKVDRGTNAVTLELRDGSQIGFSHAIVDSQNRVLTATRNTTGILRFDFATGVAQSVASGPFLQQPTALAFDPSGNLIVGGADESLTRINLTTGVQEQLTQFSFFPIPLGIQDVEVAPSGLIYVADFGFYPTGGGRLYTFDPLSRTQHLLAQGGDIYQLGDILVEPDGNLLALSSGNGVNKLLRIDAATGTQQLVRTLGDEGFMTLDRDGTVLYAEFNRDDVQRINLTTGSMSFVANIGGIGNLTGIAVVVPEPSAATLILLVAGAVSVGRKRRQV